MPHKESPSKPSRLNRTPSERSRIHIKNRRKTYLDRHPSYFTSPDLELSDSLLYDRCIRRFQTTSEREAEGRKKGYSGVLEVDLYRSEARLAALSSNSQTPAHPSQTSLSHPTSNPSSLPSQISYPRGPNGEILLEEDDEIPETKEEGLERWKAAMTIRFLRGEDGEFEYEGVDGNEEWDEVERREEQEAWFEEEEEGWVDDGEWLGEEIGAEKRGRIGRLERRGGETGVQDF